MYLLFVWGGMYCFGCGEIHNEGRLKGWAPESHDFFGPLNGNECHLGPKNPRSPQSQTTVACNDTHLIFRYYLPLRSPDYLSYCGHEAPTGGKEAGVLVLLRHDLILQDDRREAASAPTALTVVTQQPRFFQLSWDHLVNLLTPPLWPSSHSSLVFFNSHGNIHLTYSTYPAALTVVTQQPRFFQLS
jgi:hypothetical protein